MKRVAVLAGGASPERAISMISAAFVLSHIDRSRYRPMLIVATETYEWCEVPESAWASCTLDHVLTVGRSVVWCRGGIEVEGVFMSIDSAFPTMHGTHGEDGHLQGFLTLLGINYVGSGVAASVVGMHKHIFKAMMKASHLPVLPYVYLTDRATEYREVAERLGTGSLFVKPSASGSSYGTSVVLDEAAWVPALDLAFQYDAGLLVEPYLPQVREIECAVWVGRSWASSLGEIIVKEGFYDYEQKYVTNSVEVNVPADLTNQMAQRIKALAWDVCVVLGIQDYARVDFFVVGEDFYINEVNTMPGMTPISMFPKLLAVDGWSPEVWINQMIARSIS